MAWPSRQAGVVAILLLAGTASVWVAASTTRPRVFEVGFWIEPVTFESARVAPGLTPADLAEIDVIARAELAHAFAGLRVRVTDRRDARFRIAVVQDLFDARVRRKVSVAGASLALSGVGGSGSVNFLLLASNAVAFAPPDADRPAIVTAIGRGVGRTAVHELAHQFLPSLPFDSTRDVRSYEHGIASRPEHYYGQLHWDIAGPLLHERLGSPSAARAAGATP